MSYKPKHFRLPKGGVLPKDEDKDIEPYVFSEPIAIATDVALATNRPLLVSGNPGCGKSRLADAVAAVQGWSLLSRTITSRTRLETLTAEVDQLRRLNDAQTKGEHSTLRPNGYYLNPGTFWWAFDPQGASRRGLPPDKADEHEVALDYPGIERRVYRGQQPGTVLLIDEIDKAEPDLPNDLLEPLDLGRFDLPDGFSAHHENGARAFVLAPAQSRLRLLTIVTTNGERELPQAFLRRCVLLEIPDPDEDSLVRIAQKHFPGGDADRMRSVARVLVGFQEKAGALRIRPPGTAELLDAVGACEDLGIAVSTDPGSVWSHIERAVLAKDPTFRS